MVPFSLSYMPVTWNAEGCRHHAWIIGHGLSVEEPLSHHKCPNNELYYMLGLEGQHAPSQPCSSSGPMPACQEGLGLPWYVHLHCLVILFFLFTQNLPGIYGSRHAAVLYNNAHGFLGASSYQANVGWGHKHTSLGWAHCACAQSGCYVLPGLEGCLTREYALP